MRQTKKLLTILIAIAMLAVLVIPAIAAETSSGTASTLRLESVDGTASVKNASGKAMTSRSGMRLYSGYQISTEKASYAYFSLDSTKSVKMDASSKGEVFQSGKKLELKLTAGSLFFDVAAPVKANESLSIRTSTMVTGVRGTSGWVEIVDRYTTRFSLLEGELKIVSIDPLTSNERSITIVGGQTATVVYHGEMNDYVTDLFVERLTIQKLAEAGVILDMDVLGEMIVAGVIPEDATLQELINSGVILDEDALHDLLAEGGMDEETIQQLLESGMLPEDVTIQKLIQEGTIREEHVIIDGTGLTVEELQEEDVPGYVAVEVAKNEELQQRIETTTNLDVEKIIDDAQEKLAEEEAADEAADQAIQDAFETLTAEDTDPLFEEDEEESTGSSTPAAPAPSTTYDLDDPTTAEVLQALTDGYTTLNITNANLTQTWDITQTPIDSGITYNVQSGTVSVPADGTLDINGTLNVAGTLNNSGTININSMNSLDISGVLYNGYNGAAVINVGKDAPGALRVSGELGNGYGYSGEIWVASTANSSGSILEVSGSLRNGGASVAGLYFGSGGGTLEVKAGGTLENNVNITIPENSTLITSGNIQLGAAITNEGTMTVAGGSVTSSNITITNTGTMTVTGGAISCNSTSAITTTGTLNVTGGTVSGTSGIYAEAGSNVTVSGGTVTGTSNAGILGVNSNAITVTVSGNGKVFGDQYGIYNRGGTVNVSGGEVGATNTLNQTSYGIYTVDKGNVTVSGGQITSVNGTGVFQNTGALNISGSADVSGALSGIYVAAGTLDFSGGTAEGNESAGIYAATADTVTISGGTISSLTKYGIQQTKGTVAISGTTEITGSDSGIYITAGKLAMDGGTVQGTDDTSAGIWGASEENYITVTGGTVTGGGFGGIYKVSKGTLDISGDAVVSGTSHGVRLENGTNTVTIRDQVLIQATSTTAASPYALYNNGSTVEILGGTIISTHPTNGFGIRNAAGGTVNMSNCKVEAIKAINNSGVITIGQRSEVIGTEYGLYNDGADAGSVSIYGGEITATGSGSSGIYSTAGDMMISGDTDISGVKYGIYNKGGTITIKQGDIPVTVKKTSKTQDGYVLYRDGVDSGFDIGDGCRLWFYTNQDTVPPVFYAQNDDGSIYQLDEGTLNDPSTDGSSYCFELIWKSGV